MFSMNMSFFGLIILYRRGQSNVYLYSFAVTDNAPVCVRVSLCRRRHKTAVWSVLAYHRTPNEEGSVSARLTFYWFHFYMYSCT